MPFDTTWERIHHERKWGSYPKEELVRHVLGRWGNNPQLVLDLGSGQGASTWFLAREGFVPVALDGSFSALQKAKARLEADWLPYKGVQAPLTQLPFMTHCFDAVVDVVSSAHNSLDEMRVIFSEVARVLKPGGNLFSVIPTHRCARHPFSGLIATFLEEDEIEPLLGRRFNNLKILRSSYQLARDRTIDNWIITANSRS